MAYRSPAVLIPPLRFLGDPWVWWKTVHRCRGTITVAPNFAYSLSARKLSGPPAKELDLSPRRVAMNGAESVYPETIDRFSRVFGRYGFRREAFLPVYGLAENTLMVTSPPLAAPLVEDRGRRDALRERGMAVPSRGSGSRAFVGVGSPVAGTEIVVANDGGPVPERAEAEILVRGSSRMMGYLTKAGMETPFSEGGWFATGDLGYLAGGHLFVTGRKKDLIVRRGVNLHPEDIETAAATVAGLRKGRLVCLGVPREEEGTEALVLLAETRETSAARRAEITHRVTGVVHAERGVLLDHVVLLPPRTIPLTSSGKVRRQTCRERYLAGELRPSSLRRGLTAFVRTFLAPPR